MAESWYIDAGGRAEGPLSLDELRERAADGRLRPADTVSSDGLSWVAASEVLGAAFPPSTVVQVVEPPRNPLLDTVVSGRTDLDSAPRQPAEGFSPLDSVPGYELQGALGTGACGVVFRARQVSLNRVVALKTVRMAENTSPDMLARFEQEAVSLARLQHPNIVAVYDCGHTDGRAYFAMELLDGEDLGRRLERAGPLDERTAWLVARQTAAALAHAATLGVIHRDVKPANLFLVPPPTGFTLPFGVPMVKVTDFGLALTRRGAGEGDQRQTAAGMVVGTPIYMSPEQFSGGTIDPRADIYGLGATVFHALTGSPPFDGRTVWEVMMKKSRPAPRLGPPVSPETADLVGAMLAVRPEDRPADYAELIARIDALPCLTGAFSVSGLPAVCPLPRPASAPAITLPAPAAPAPRRRRRWVYALAAAVVLGVGAFAAFRVLSKPATYTTGAPEALYDGKSVLGWSGAGLTVEPDDERATVLTGGGTLTRPLRPVPNFRVVLSLDLHRASAVEVVLAAGEGPPDSATRWVVRLDRKEVAFGRYVGHGNFEPVGPALRVPSAEELAEQGRTPYLEVRYERAGGTLAAWFRGQPLGHTTDGDLRATELRLTATGGPIRIASAEQVELVEQE